MKLIIPKSGLLMGHFIQKKELLDHYIKSYDIDQKDCIEVIIDDRADFAISLFTLNLTSETQVTINLDKNSSKINSPILNIVPHNFQMNVEIN